MNGFFQRSVGPWREHAVASGWLTHQRAGSAAGPSSAAVLDVEAPHAVVVGAIQPEEAEQQVQIDAVDVASDPSLTFYDM